MRSKKLALLGISAIIIAGCGISEDDPTSGSTNCDIAEQKEYVKSEMQSDYLWYDSVPNVNTLNFDTASDVLDAMKVSQDRWSYITEQSDFDSFFEEGEFVGVGIQTRKNAETNEIRVAFVYPNSPAEEIGLLRGDYIISVNEFTAEQLQSNETWNTAWGDASAGVVVDIDAQTPGASVRSLTATKAIVQIETAPVVDVIDTTFGRVGYLMFLSFIEPSFDDLAQAFAELQDANIDEFVLDLRYNGGGRISVANQLASYIGGDLTAGETFTLLRFNDLNTGSNTRYLYTSPVNSLGINRVIVLTSGSTCSASESVINGLSPFVTVTTVGETTCGKPVGMVPVTHSKLCNKVLSAINFKGENASQESDFFDGLSPTCEVADDIDSPLGDENEAMLSTALSLLENGQCPTSNAQAQSTKSKFEPHYSGWQRVLGAY